MDQGRANENRWTRHTPGRLGQSALGVYGGVIDHQLTVSESLAQRAWTGLCHPQSLHIRITWEN